MKKTLAIKYRPHTWGEVVEQGSTKEILQQQLDSNTVKNAYLFVGSAGTGKTTCARIFADEINGGKGNPIELDAASNSSVDDVRNIIQQAKTASLNSEYKVFIIDECHSLSNTAWQAFLKLLEEPPAKTVFIFCTTNPEKIPKTILSRVQRYDFKRISHQGIVSRLTYILEEECDESWDWKEDAVEYIAKLADGGMRDAITLMDKCLSYSKDLTTENIVKALGTADYTFMMQLTDAIGSKDSKQIIQIIEDIYNQGVDMKQFIKQYTNFVLDVKKWFILGGSFDYLGLPNTTELHEWLINIDFPEDTISQLLTTLVYLNGEIKYDNSPKNYIEAKLLMLEEDIA